MSDNTELSDSLEEENSKNPDQSKNEAEAISSLELVLAEINRQQDYRRHQVDTSVQLSSQLIGFASLTSPFTALSTVQVPWLKYVALMCLVCAIAFGLIDIFNPTRVEDELPVGKLRDEACVKDMRFILLYQIDNKIENEKKSRADEDKRIRWIKRGYMFLGAAVLFTVLSIIDYCSVINWMQQHFGCSCVQAAVSL